MIMRKWTAMVSVCGVLTLAAGPALAVVVGPYTPDANTLHLWQFPETSGGVGAITGDSGVGTDITLTVQGNASPSLGALSYSAFTADFGRALDVTSTQSRNRAENTTDSLQSDWQSGTGAFTYEAIIKTSDITPTGSNYQILINRDTTDAPARRRIFIWRIDAGNLTFAHLDDTVGGQVVQDLAAAIPTTGTHAFDPDSWFHVAVTYDGNAATPGNFKFYWTLVDENITQANEIFSGNMIQDIRTIDIAPVGPTVSTTIIGNWSGDSLSLNLRGMMDEVRVSNVARTADQFIFAEPEPQEQAAVPEPATLGALTLAGLALGRRRARA